MYTHKISRSILEKKSLLSIFYFASVHLIILYSVTATPLIEQQSVWEKR